MNNDMDLSIIIISYNTKSLLEKCLTSIYTNFPDLKVNTEVIVVDNGSKDGSCVLVRSKFSQVRLIENITNRGFGQANNQGINAARGSTILLLNSDIVVLDQAIANLYLFFKIQTQEIILGGKLLNTDRTPQPSCGPQYSLLMIIMALFFKGDYCGITRYSPLKTREVDWIMGACMMARKSTFQKIAFDESIFMYMEEIDLQYRAKKRGVKIYFYPRAQFLHQGAGSSHGRATPILNVFRGFLFYYKKHFGTGKQLFLRIILVFKSLSAILLFSFQGKKYDREIYIKALKIAVS